MESFSSSKRYSGRVFGPQEIEQVRDMLLTGKHASEDDLKAIDQDIKAIVNEAADFSKESPEPALDELWTDIYADVKEA